MSPPLIENTSNRIKTGGRFTRDLPNVDKSRPLRIHLTTKFSVKQYTNCLPLLFEDSPSFRYGFPTLAL